MLERRELPLKAELGVDAFELGYVAPSDAKCFELELDRTIRLQRDELAAQESVVTMSD